jgi:hypothetical protein
VLINQRTLVLNVIASFSLSHSIHRRMILANPLACLPPFLQGTLCECVWLLVNGAVVHWFALCPIHVFLLHAPQRQSAWLTRSLLLAIAAIVPLAPPGLRKLTAPDV